MRLLPRPLLGLLVVLTCFPLPGRSQIETSWTYVSSYIWRGFDLNPYHRPVIQSSLGVDLGSSGVHLKGWGSFSFHDRELNEMNLIASYTYTGMKDFSLTAGIIHYGWYFVDYFDFSLDTSQEVFLIGGLTHVLFQPSLAVYYDFTNGDGLYLEMRSEETLTLSRRLGARFTASLGYNGGQWLAEGVKSGFSDLNGGIDIPLKIGKIELVPFARWTRVLLEAIGKKTHFRYGISLIFDIE